MKLRSVLVLLCGAATACHDAPVAPVSPPDGLPVSMRKLSAPDAFSGSNPVVVAQGDSVMVTAQLTEPHCFDVRTSAGMVNGRLVVTFTASTPEVPRVCTLDIRTALFRFVVRPAPAGRYTAVLRQRFESGTQIPQEREVVRGPVAVP